MHDLQTSKYGFDLSVFVALLNSFFRSVESMSVLSCLLDKDIMLFLPDDPYGRLVMGPVKGSLMTSDQNQYLQTFA